VKYRLWHGRARGCCLLGSTKGLKIQHNDDYGRIVAHTSTLRQWHGGPSTGAVPQRPPVVSWEPRVAALHHVPHPSVFRRRWGGLRQSKDLRKPVCNQIAV